MTIRTPDQRLRVFVSSTLTELADERRAARAAIEELHLTPVMFELGARPHPPRALYRAYLEQSDVFVGLYWERYGWMAPGEEISGLEDEYRLSSDRPKLIYLKEPARREPRLEALIDRIRADDRASYRAFSDARELRGLVADDLAVLLTERFAGATGPPSVAAPTVPLMPRPLTSLVGRSSQVAEVVARLEAPGGRLVTLVGPGGIGKTRLAISIAERLRTSERFPDGVAFIGLGEVVEPRLMVPTIASALGLREEAGISIGMALREVLARRRMLLVLDNLEQLADAAPELADLLAAAPDLVVLGTSRAVLNVRGEQLVTVEPLDVPDLDEPDPEGCAAVRLFLDRAAGVAARWRDDPADRAAVAELCRRLDGIPLAIELAAARARVLRPSALLERMGHRRLALLADGARDLPVRQRTLRETLAWSHSLLEPPEQALFRRMAAFAGSADLEAIELIANPEGDLDVLDALTGLTDASLVRPLDAPEPRFGLLETIREFAVEKLEASGEADATRGRHRDHYLALAGQANDRLLSHDQIAWLRRYARENDNFRAVFRRALRADDAATALRLGLGLAGFWHFRSLSTEGRSWMDATRALPSATPVQQATAWTIGAVLAFWQGDVEAIEAGIDDAEAKLRDADQPRVLAFIDMLRGFVSPDPGSSEARAAIERAAAFFESDAADAMVRLTGAVARTYMARLRGDYAEAAERARGVLSEARRTGDRFAEGIAAMLLGSAAIAIGDLAEARAQAVAAARAYAALENATGLAYAVELAAAAELGEGHHEAALRLYAIAIRLRRLHAWRPWQTDRMLEVSLEGGLRAIYGEELEALMAREENADIEAELERLAAAG